MSGTIDFYNSQAQQLATQYDSLSFEQVHSSWLDRLVQLSPGKALDVGAGSGRDAQALAQRGWQVTAVEPAVRLRARGAARNPDIRWLDDRLPQLSALPESVSYRLILLSAVWMHLPESQRAVALARLCDLLDSDGILVITLRHGPGDPARPMYPVSVSELESLCAPLGLELLLLEGEAKDWLQRNQVHWQTVALRHRK